MHKQPSMRDDEVPLRAQQLSQGFLALSGILLATPSELVSSPNGLLGKGHAEVRLPLVDFDQVLTVLLDPSTGLVAVPMILVALLSQQGGLTHIENRSLLAGRRVERDEPFLIRSRQLAEIVQSLSQLSQTKNMDVSQLAPMIVQETSHRFYSITTKNGDVLHGKQELKK